MDVEGLLLSVNRYYRRRKDLHLQKTDHMHGLRRGARGETSSVKAQGQMASAEAEGRSPRQWYTPVLEHRPVGSCGWNR